MEALNSYRGYVLVRNAADPHKPQLIVGYVRAPKYGDAWTLGRAIASGDETKAKGAKLFADPEGKKALDIPAGATFVACDNMRKRNQKLDRAALQAIIDDPNTSPEKKIEAMQAMIGQSQSTGGKQAQAAAS